MFSLICLSLYVSRPPFALLHPCLVCSTSQGKIWRQCRANKQTFVLSWSSLSPFSPASKIISHFGLTLVVFKLPSKRLLSINFTLWILVTIIMSVVGRAWIVWRTLIVATIVIVVLRLMADSPIETVSLGRITSISWIVSRLLTLVASVESMLIIVRSWGWQTRWVIQRSRVGLFAMVISIVGPASVNLVAAIVMTWGASMARII